MKNITPCLWFESNAEEAVRFYTSVFKNSKVGKSTRYGKEGFEIHHMPEGTLLTQEFELGGQPFLALHGGPGFKFNPAVSFLVNFDPSRDTNARTNLDELWSKLSQGGTPLMPLDKYPFSERYGWIQDKYGLTWQLILSNPSGEERPFITPFLLFVKAAAGKAEEAINLYRSVFSKTQSGTTARYPGGMAPEKEGTIMFADFMIEGQWFAAMDSAREHKFSFNEAVSFMLNCETQGEIDRYWGMLSSDPAAEACGWLKDKFGVSWQVVPTVVSRLLADPDKNKSGRVMKAILQSKKPDIAALERAYEGK